MLEQVISKTIKKYYFLLPLLLVLISSMVYYLTGYLHFSDDYSQYFSPADSIHDETIFYFSDVIYLYNNFSLTIFVSELQTWFMSKLFNLSIFSVVPTAYFPLIVNVTTTLTLFILLYFTGRDIFKYNVKYNLFFIFVFSLTLGWGITTYNEWIELFTLSPNGLASLFRQESPSTTITLFIFGIYLVFKFFVAEKFKLNYLVFGAILLIFSYPYYTPFIAVFLSLLLPYYFFNRNFADKTRFSAFYIVLSFFLCVWIFVYMLGNNSDYSYMLGKNFTYSINYKLAIINMIFVGIGLYFYNKTRSLYEKNILILIIIALISGVIAYHSNVIIGYEIQRYHWDVYLLKPLQWVLVLYLVFQNKFYKDNINFLVSLVLSVLFFLNTWIASHEMYVDNKKQIGMQMKVIKSYQSLSKYILSGEHFTTLDPLLVMMSRVMLPKAKIDINFAGHNKNSTGEENIQSYLMTARLHKLTQQEVIDLYYSGSISYKYSHSEVESLFEYILMHTDGNDNIFQSLSSKDKIITSDNFKEYIFNQYALLEDVEYNGYIVVNKIQLLEDKVNIILENKDIIFEDNILIILKYKDKNKEKNVK